MKGVLFLATTLALLGIGIGSADVVINEMLPDVATDWYPNGDIGDMNDEFIELYNSGDEDVDVTNYTLMDTSYRRSPGKYMFPEGSVIPAHGFLVVYSIESGVFQGNNGDGIMLNDSSGNLVDEKRYDISLGGDVSFVRVPDGGDWNSSFQPTPGEPNVQASLIRAIHLSSEKENLSFGVDDLPVTDLVFGEGSSYQKVAPGLHKVELIDPEDGTILLDIDLDLGIETKTTLFVRDPSHPIIAKDATGMPEVKNSWLRFVNLVSDRVSVMLPAGGKIWFEGEKTEVKVGGCLYEDVEFEEVTDYVAAYSSDLDVAIVLSKGDESILVDELGLEDECIYTFVLAEDPKTLEKVLMPF